MSALNEMSSDLDASRLGNAHLWVTLAGLFSFRNESQIGTYVTALLDAERILDGEDESQGGVRADAIDLLQELCLGVDVLSES